MLGFCTHHARRAGAAHALAALAGLAPPTFAQCADTLRYRGDNTDQWFRETAWVSVTSGASRVPTSGDVALLPASPVTPRSIIFDAPVLNVPVCGLDARGADDTLRFAFGRLLVGPSGVTVGSSNAPPASLRLSSVVGSAVEVGLATGMLGVGIEPGSTGSLFIDRSAGAGPLGLRLLAPSGPASAVIGGAGTGFLTVSDAFFANDTGVPADVTLGQQPSGVGTIVLTGPDAIADILTGQLAVGLAGDGSVIVQDKAQWFGQSQTPVLIGPGLNSRGLLEVVGESARFVESTAPIEAGFRGSALVRIVDRAELHTPALRVGPGGRVEITGTLQGSVFLEGGTLEVLDRTGRAGALDAFIGGDLVMAGVAPRSERPVTGTLTVRLPSGDLGEASLLNVAGRGMLAGTLVIEAAQGVSPIPGVPVTVAGFGEGVGGFFSGLVRPVFPGGITLAPAINANTLELVPVPFEPRKPNRPLTPQTLKLFGAVTDADRADFNNDGFPDIALATTNGPQEGGQILVLINRGQQFGAPLGYDVAEVYSGDGIGEAVGVVARDFDNDARPDLAVINRGMFSNQLVLLRNTADSPGQRFSPDPRGPVTIQGEAVSIDSTDIDGDGRTDLAILTDLSTGRAEARGFLTGGKLVAAMNKEVAIEVCDVDTDDGGSSVTTVQGGAAVVASKNENEVLYYTPMPGGGYAPGPAQFPTGLGPNEVIAADLTGDGLEEIITADTTGGTLSVLVAVSTAPPEYLPAILVTAAEPAALANPRSLLPVDYDEDGDTDLAYIATQDQADVVRVVPNDGVDAGLLTLGSPVDVDLSGASGPVSLAIADNDGDGDDDLLVVFETVFRPAARGPSLAVNDAALLDGVGCAADINNDGMLNVNDVIAFVNLYNAGAHAADISPAFGSLDVNDIITFVQSFNGGTCD